MKMCKFGTKKGVTMSKRNHRKSMCKENFQSILDLLFLPDARGSGMQAYRLASYLVMNSQI